MARVRAHPPADAREARAREAVLTALAELPRPFDRDAGPTHVTASAVVVGRRGILLHRHRRLGRWLQPGGHLDPAEEPAAAAVRECAEETGLTARHPDSGPVLLHLDVHGAADGHVHLDLRYLLVGPDAPPAPGPGESQEVAWYGWDEAVALADEALVGALAAARRLAGAGTGVSGPTPGSTMAEPFDTLMEVQEHDTVIDQLRHRRATLPERASLAEVTVRRTELAASLSSLQAQIDDLASRQGRLEEQIATTAARRHQLEERMRTAVGTAARDLQAMDHEVGLLAARQQQLEEDELVLLEEEEPLDQALAEQSAVQAALDAEAGRLAEAVEAVEAALDAELVAEEGRRTGAAGRLPVDLAERYERLRSKLGGVGAARLIADRCDGCHLTLSSVEVDRIRHLPSDALVTCPQCDRILVR